MICERCGTESMASTGSMFTMEIICIECRELEEAHPKYEEARRVESEQVLAGNYNFEGIGLPKDLRPKRSPAGGRR